MNNNVVQVVWKDPRSRRNFVIGEVKKKDKNKYEFYYTGEIDEARKKGFQLFLSFDDRNKTYESDSLFSVFASRLPDRKRRDIEEILSKYQLKEYDEFELLKCGAELPIDTLKFIVPIDEISEGFHKTFYVEGCRHYLPCGGKPCENGFELKEPFMLMLDEKNKHDNNAVKIVDSTEAVLGYVPRYYSAKIAEAIKAGKRFNVHMDSFNKETDCNTCLKVSLSL